MMNEEKTLMVLPKYTRRHSDPSLYKKYTAFDSLLSGVVRVTMETRAHIQAMLKAHKVEIDPTWPSTQFTFHSSVIRARQVTLDYGDYVVFNEAEGILYIRSAEAFEELYAEVS